MYNVHEGVIISPPPPSLLLWQRFTIILPLPTVVTLKRLVLENNMGLSRVTTTTSVPCNLPPPCSQSTVIHRFLHLRTTSNPVFRTPPPQCIGYGRATIVAASSTAATITQRLLNIAMMEVSWSIMTMILKIMIVMP